MLKRIFFVSILILSEFTLNVNASPTKKPWTFLVYLNAFNNLDRFGTEDMNEMEVVGSTQKINVVTQWASYEKADVRRILIQKDSDNSVVSSPVIENLGKIDMGDYKNLVEFVKWGKEKFPADHYFLVVWNHGSGWHQYGLKGNDIKPTDISYDDYSNNHITTEELGLAMSEIKTVLGQSLDIYGSDACLMNMAEVVGEMKNSVKVVIGSQHLEPGAGWPYDTFLRDWDKKSNATAEDVSKILVKNYTDSYPNRTEITLSAYDLTKYNELTQSITMLKNEIISASATLKEKIKKAANETIEFYSSDYRDVYDFVEQIQKLTTESEIKRTTLNQIKKSVDHFVIANGVSSDQNTAKGLSFWLPVSQYTYDEHANRYKELVFNKDTEWLSAAQIIAQ